METLTPKGRLFNEILVEVFRLRARLLESSEGIAALAGLTSARWQETVDAMKRDGLIEISANPDHKRARLIAPTGKARKALDLLRPREIQFAGLMGGRHSLDELQTTLDVLRKARATLEGTERITS